MLARKNTLAADVRDDRFAAAAAGKIRELYGKMGQNSRCRHYLLGLLIQAGHAESTKTLVELLIADPPTRDTDIVEVFSPLFRRRDLDVSLFFPRLLDGIAHARLAAPILDLANFLTREEIAAEHPAAARTGQLAALLAEVARRLAHFEKNPDLAGPTPEKISERVSESVTLAVSLCDALALIGDKSVIGSLTQSLIPSHRRLRTEAAAALAKLDDEQGRTELIKLAAEPVARLRVLAYADELGLSDKIDPQYSSLEARGEAELALHLAQPTQLGFPPSDCELAERRTQYWPGYDEPIECFLFRFNYRLGPRHYSNIGITGPLTHAVTADLGDLPPHDIYALFAGWQAEHDEIYEVDVERLTEDGRREVRRLEHRLALDGYQDFQPITLGYFFGEPVLIARASREEQCGLAVADSADAFWYSTEKGARPLGPSEVYWIYKGRKLLAAFNA